MKRWLLCIVMVMLCHADTFGVKPTLNLSKTWAWPPRSYYDAPYRSEGGSLWSQLQQVGILDPLDDGRELQLYFSYGYYGYDPVWGSDNCKQGKLSDPIYYQTASEKILSKSSGTAPIKSCNPKEEMRWDSTINSFLKNLNPEEWPIINTNTLKKSIPDYEKVKTETVTH